MSGQAAAVLQRGTPWTRSSADRFRRTPTPSSLSDRLPPSARIAGRSRECSISPWADCLDHRRSSEHSGWGRALPSPSTRCRANGRLSDCRNSCDHLAGYQAQATRCSSDTPHAPVAPIDGYRLSPWSARRPFSLRMTALQEDSLPMVGVSLADVAYSRGPPSATRRPPGFSYAYGKLPPGAEQRMRVLSWLWVDIEGCHQSRVDLPTDAANSTCLIPDVVCLE